MQPAAICTPLRSPGQDRAADTGETENRAEQSERLGEQVAAERLRHDRHALRDDLGGLINECRRAA